MLLNAIQSNRNESHTPNLSSIVSHHPSMVLSSVAFVCENKTFCLTRMVELDVHFSVLYSKGLPSWTIKASFIRQPDDHRFYSEAHSHSARQMTDIHREMRGWVASHRWSTLKVNGRSDGLTIPWWTLTSVHVIACSCSCIVLVVREYSALATNLATSPPEGVFMMKLNPRKWKSSWTETRKAELNC